MKSILNNPYRVLGILAGTSQKEQESKTKRILKYLEVEEELPNDFHLSFLGEINRNIENVKTSISYINLDKDKLLHSLFWFIEGNSITDEPAIDFLKEGEEGEAIQIWEKLVKDENDNFEYKLVSKKNFSAFLNLSNLYLYDFSDVEKGLRLKMHILDSDFYLGFIEKIVDKTYSISQVDLQLLFLNEFKNQIGDDDASKWAFETYLLCNNFKAKKIFLKDYSNIFIAEIEAKINYCKAARKSDKSKSNTHGISLQENCQQKIESIKEFIGANDIRYTNVADKLADELLQCGIDYFLHFRDTNIDPSNVAINLFKQASVIAQGEMSKQRIKENLNELQDWVKDKPLREKEQQIVEDVKKLKQLIDEFEKEQDANASSLYYLGMCTPLLLKLKNILGYADELYLNISTRIASDAQQLCIRKVNSSQEHFLDCLKFNLESQSAKKWLLEAIESAIKVNLIIDDLDLKNEFKVQFQNNKNALFSIKQQVEQIRNQPTPTRAVKPTPSGCYIATMAYGSYEHPQVLELRAYRDNVLAKTTFGRIFIKTYYFISPKLVSLLKNNSYINSKIRMFLDKFIIKLKSKK